MGAGERGQVREEVAKPNVQPFMVNSSKLRGASPDFPET